MKKVLKVFSITVIVIFGLSVFGWMVHHVSKGDKKFGMLTKPLKFIYNFPDLFTKSVEEVQALPKTFIKTPPYFKAINKLESDLMVLSTYSEDDDSRSVVLRNLKTDSIHYKWNLQNPFGKHARIINPFMQEDKSLVYAIDYETGLRKVDSLTNIIWEQDSVFVHHSITSDAEGNFWACSLDPDRKVRGMYTLEGKTVIFVDHGITKFDAATGRILFNKSFTEILTENNLANYLIKTSEVKDPVHLNDVQPALKTTKYYQKDDVFISSRSLSIVVQYRPSTNKVIRVIEGPFSTQHDVDFLNDSTLTIFNNNYYATWFHGHSKPPKDSSKLKMAGNLYSNIVRYDLHNDSISYIGDSVFRANRIFTNTEGLIEYIDSATYFVEEQNHSFYWIIRNDEVIYRNNFESQHEGYHHLANWTRIIK